MKLSDQMRDTWVSGVETGANGAVDTQEAQAGSVGFARQPQCQGIVQNEFSVGNGEKTMQCYIHS